MMKKLIALSAALIFSFAAFVSANGSEEDFLNRAIKYKSEGRYDEAAAECTKAIALDPKSAKAYVARGEIYFKKGNFELAIADYTEAIKINPRDASVIRKRAESYDRKGENDKAREDMQRLESLRSPGSRDRAKNLPLGSGKKAIGSHDEFPWDAIALDVVLIDKNTGQAIDAGRVPDVGEQLPGHMKAATAECEKMAGDEAKKRKISDWDYYCCTVTSTNACSTKQKKY